MSKFFIIAAHAILLVALLSCGKDPIPSPPPVTYSVSISKIGNGTVTADKLSGIALGSSVTVKFTPDSDYSLYSVKLNGVMIEIQPSKTEVSYIITNINKNQTIEIIFEETDVLIFSVKSINEKPWMWTKASVYKVEGNIFAHNMDLTQAEKSDKYYFLYPSMDAFVYQEDGGIRKGKWILKQKNLKIDDITFPLLEVTPNKVVIKANTAWSSYYQCYTYAVYTHERI